MNVDDSNSPTAIALGSSAIVKVSGQNCFRALYGSLGQIRLGPPEGSAEGSAKVPPRFQQGCTKVPPKFSKFPGVSDLLGQFVLGCQKVLWKVPPRFYQGSAKVSPRFHQGFTKVVQVSWSLWSSGADPFWGAKRFVEGSPITSLNLSPSSSTLFCIFLNSVSFETFSHSKGLGAKWHVWALRLSAIVKVLGQNDTFVFLASLQQLAFASQKVLWSVPQTVLHIGLTVSCESKLCEVLTCLTHTNPVRRKQPIMSLLLGYSLGLYIYIFFFGAGTHTSKWNHFWNDPIETANALK